MNEKTVSYIKNLSDSEIKEQLNDFLLWAREYEQALKQELKERQKNVAGTPVKGEYLSNSDNTQYSFITPQDISGDDSVDFETAIVISERVSQLEKQKTIELLKELKERSRDKLSKKEIDLLNYEINECEQHLQEVSMDKVNLSSNLCSVCGNELDCGSVFCGKCGNRVN